MAAYLVTARLVNHIPTVEQDPKYHGLLTSHKDQTISSLLTEPVNQMACTLMPMQEIILLLEHGHEKEGKILASSLD